MLVTHCPHLQELTFNISQLSRRVWDVRHITKGRWPKLSKLALGDCDIESGESTLYVDINSPFMCFLAAHPSLQIIYLPSLSSFPKTIALPPSTLPCLKFFGGNLGHIEGLPMPSFLRSLSLVYEPITVPMMPVIHTVLQKLTSLESLSIWLQTSTRNPDYVHTDHSSLFRSLLNSCPRLSHLELTCSSSTTFSIVSLIPVRIDSY